MAITKFWCTYSDSILTLTATCRSCLIRIAEQSQSSGQKTYEMSSSLELADILYVFLPHAQWLILQCLSLKLQCLRDIAVTVTHTAMSQSQTAMSQWHCSSSWRTRQPQIGAIPRPAPRQKCRTSLSFSRLRLALPGSGKRNRTSRRWKMELPTTSEDLWKCVLIVGLLRRNLTKRFWLSTQSRDLLQSIYFLQNMPNMNMSWFSTCKKGSHIFYHIAYSEYYFPSSAYREAWGECVNSWQPLVLADQDGQGLVVPGIRVCHRYKLTSYYKASLVLCQAATLRVYKDRDEASEKTSKTYLWY